MQLKVDRKLTGRELSDATISKDYIMFEKFQSMWQEINRAVSYHKLDSLDKDAEITFSITWEMGEE